MRPGLYIVVRTDLPVGLQASQAAHAARQFQHEYPKIEARWFLESNVLVLVGVKSLDELNSFREQAELVGVRAALFHDEELSPSFTALALEPGADSRRLCKGLPLLFS